MLAHEVGGGGDGGSAGGGRSGGGATQQLAQSQPNLISSLHEKALEKSLHAFPRHSLAPHASSADS